MVGSWNVDVITGSLPEKVATAFAKLNEQLIGAEYTPVAYLGSQVVNGTNHAVLAEQLLTTGKDTKNAVVVIFNEKPNEVEATLVGIERVVESGDPEGGITVDIKTDIPAEAKAAFDAAFEAFVGSKVEPFALIGTQVVNGINYIFAAEVTPIAENPVKSVDVVVVNNSSKEVSFSDILNNKYEKAYSYSFTKLA